MVINVAIISIVIICNIIDYMGSCMSKDETVDWLMFSLGFLLASIIFMLYLCISPIIYMVFSEYKTTHHSYHKYIINMTKDYFVVLYAWAQEIIEEHRYRSH